MRGFSGDTPRLRCQRSSFLCVLTCFRDRGDTELRRERTAIAVYTIELLSVDAINWSRSRPRVRRVFACEARGLQPIYLKVCNLVYKRPGLCVRECSPMPAYAAQQRGSRRRISRTAVNPEDDTGTTTHPTALTIQVQLRSDVPAGARKTR